MSATDSVSVSVDVAVAPATAFEVFTRDINVWWQTGPKYRFLGGGPGLMTFEPGPQGRLVQIGDTGKKHEVGRIMTWEPPRRLVLEWRLPNFAPDESTQVEIDFEPIDTGTRVTVVHRGWDTLPPSHPARHGLAGREFVVMRGAWWGEQLRSMKNCAANRSDKT